MSLAAARWSASRVRMRREKLLGGCRSNDLLRRRSEARFNGGHGSAEDVRAPAVSRLKALLKPIRQE